MISPEIKIPADLPMDFVFALMLAAPFWESAVTFDLSDFYAELAKDADKQQAWNDNMEDILDCIALCSLPVTINGSLVMPNPRVRHCPKKSYCLQTAKSAPPSSFCPPSPAEPLP